MAWPESMGRQESCGLAPEGLARKSNKLGSATWSPVPTGNRKSPCSVVDLDATHVYLHGYTSRLLSREFYVQAVYSSRSGGSQTQKLHLAPTTFYLESQWDCPAALNTCYEPPKPPKDPHPPDYPWPFNTAHLLPAVLLNPGKEKPFSKGPESKTLSTYPCAYGLGQGLGGR